MANHQLKERTRELVTEFCAGNNHAFAELYDLYIQMLFNYAISDVENDYLHTEQESMQSAQVAHLMEHLTRRQRQAITLYYLEQRKYDEICEIMQMNYHSVRNLMHRGMLKLREAAM